MKETLELNGKIFDCTGSISARLGVGKTALWNWKKAGLLPQPVRIGIRDYYRRDQVEDLMASRGTKIIR